MDVLIHHDWHTGNEMEHGWHGNGALVTLPQHHDRFFLRGFDRRGIILSLPPVLGQEDPHLRTVLLLERQCRFDVQVPPLQFSGVTTMTPLVISGLLASHLILKSLLPLTCP